MSTPGLNSSSSSITAALSGASRPADLFEDLWQQLRDCHQKALQELEAKVSKLKKERCLDAQRLEEFYSRNQQLKEQHKTLQSTISLLEERLREGVCDRCAILEETMKNKQNQNLHLIATLKNEKNSLEDENRRLNAELEKLKVSRPEPQQTSPEQEDGVIPDSPILPSSLPMANKLKRRKNNNKSKHVRYAEMPLLQCHSSLFSEVQLKLKKESLEVSENHGKADVLVPETCQMDTSQTLNMSHPLEEVVAETCGFDLPDCLSTETAPGLQSSSKSPNKCKGRLRLHQPSLASSSTLTHCLDSTLERSPSLLPSVKRGSGDSYLHIAKRRKEEDHEVQEEKKQKEGQQTLPELIKRPSTPLKEPPDQKVLSAQHGASGHKSDGSCVSPFPKRTNRKTNEDVNGDVDSHSVGRKRTPLQDVNASLAPPAPADGMCHVEPMWSIDPAVILSMYDSESCAADQEQHVEPVDNDCTLISHSLLQLQDGGVPPRDSSVSGACKKADDSLDQMFDTTAYGEYKSYNMSPSCHTQPLHQHGDHDDDEEEEEEEEDEHNPPENSPAQSKENKARGPTFAHVAVVRKKDERRKLKGTTCKECETYYAHLPEEERQKKLSACSRHRFRYIPPCTPENFWEVGFPSTQTCIERGYIKEEKNPQARLRRRQPFNALFSPKSKERDT
ncbi:DNA endonuclease RBBP8 isoform X2 [Myripristis murdjan]|uniref:DNA endonuclease RBBP8 isoform X2 n=1 Tax=Myripristis murdjan TaxID=586833 RepID=UPI001176265B|nr:DNA endonuclease RBBP8 isoform X2 [Myripristis murdjan]